MARHPIHPKTLSILLVLAAAALAACGNRGALYLPDDPPASPVEEQVQGDGSGAATREEEEDEDGEIRPDPDPRPGALRKRGMR